MSTYRPSAETAKLLGAAFARAANHLQIACFVCRCDAGATWKVYFAGLVADYDRLDERTQRVFIRSAQSEFAFLDTHPAVPA